MTVPGPGSRFLYLFDGTANLGVNLTGAVGQVGDFTIPGFEETLQELHGSAATYPTIARTGHRMTPDWTVPMWADSALQELLDDLHGVTAADRKDLRLVVCGINTDAVGQKATAGRMYLRSVNPLSPVAALTELHATFGFTGAAEILTILHELSAEVADGDTKAGDSQDHGASTATGGYGYFGYTTYTADGATGLAPRIVDSADDVTYAALCTFTTVTATTGGGQRSALALTETVDRHTATDWDFTGSPGAGTTATFFIGFQRGQG